MKECKYCRTKYEDSLAACPNCGGTKIITLEEYKEELALKKRKQRTRKTLLPLWQREGNCCFQHWLAL